MKKILLLALSFILINLTYGQTKNKLVGKWQAEGAALTSMNFDTYHFSTDGKFAFEPNSYNGLNRIISINGSYKIKGDTLFLTPEYTKEVTGGFPIRSESTTLSDTWEIVQGKTKIIPCRKTEQSAVIKINPNNKNITLDDRKFYRIK